jgi:hypothetical protein
MLELSFLIITITIIVVWLYFTNNQPKPVNTEGFEGYYLTACPPGYKSFYTTEGSTVCCDGEIVANKCLGDNQCILNGGGSNDMPNCVFALLKMYEEKAKSKCPPSMRQYFEDKGRNIAACTEGRLNETLSGPRHASQPTCVIFPDLNDNRNIKESCENQTLLDDAACFGNNCTKELMQPVNSAPPLVAIGFTDNLGMHRIAYTRQSIENFLNVTNPNWKNQGMDLSKNINVAEVAKAYYIDRTMDQSEVQF